MRASSLASLLVSPAAAVPAADVLASPLASSSTRAPCWARKRSGLKVSGSSQYLGLRWIAFALISIIVSAARSSEVQTRSGESTQAGRPDSRTFRYDDVSDGVFDNGVLGDERRRRVEAQSLVADGLDVPQVLDSVLVGGAPAENLVNLAHALTHETTTTGVSHGTTAQASRQEQLSTQRAMGLRSPRPRRGCPL